MRGPTPHPRACSANLSFKLMSAVYHVDVDEPEPEAAPALPAAKPANEETGNGRDGRLLPRNYR